MPNRVIGGEPIGVHLCDPVDLDADSRTIPYELLGVLRYQLPPCVNNYWVELSALAVSRDPPVDVRHHRRVD